MAVTCGQLIELLQTQNPETPVELVDLDDSNLDIRMVIQSAGCAAVQLCMSRWPAYGKNNDVVLYEAPRD